MAAWLLDLWASHPCSRPEEREREQGKINEWAYTSWVHPIFLKTPPETSCTISDLISSSFVTWLPFSAREPVKLSVWRRVCKCVCVYVCVHVFMGIAATLQDSIKIIRGMGMVLQPPETWPSRGRFRTEVRGLCCPHLCDSICHLGHSSTPRALSLLKSPVLIALLFSSLCKAQTWTCGERLFLPPHSSLSCSSPHSVPALPALFQPIPEAQPLWLLGGSSWIPAANTSPVKCEWAFHMHYDS